MNPIVEKLSNSTDQSPKIMGILNITPDSFSDGGQYNKPERAVAHALAMAEQGADIIDIGGESTRPGSARISAEEQIQRVVEVIRLVKQALNGRSAISIDTTLSAVADAALRAGADIINDVSAATESPKMLELAAQHKVPIILMHKQGSPEKMQDNPHYDSVVKEISQYLQDRAEAALAVGIPQRHIILDPGIGFGKRRIDNLQLLASLNRFVALGYKVLLGTSRKRFMGAMLSNPNQQQLAIATATTTALGVAAGVRLFRVHDVEENRIAADIAYGIFSSQSLVQYE